MMPQESDLRAKEGIPVEVKLLYYGGYYDAFLMEIFDTDALIHFPMNWIKETRFPLSQIRFPPDEDMEKVEMRENMIAEAYIHKQPGIYNGWYKCDVMVLKSEFCVLQYLGDHSGVDFVNSDVLRPINNKPSLSWDMLHVHVVSIPKGIQEYASTEGVHNFLKRAIKGVLIKYNPLFHVVSVISPNEDDILTAQILEKPYLQSLSQKNSTLRLIGNLDRRIEKAKNGGFVEEFTISDNFKDIAIRKKITNLRDVKIINGISNVEFDRKSYKYIINGETEEALTEARELLEITMEYYFIPKIEISQLLKIYSKNKKLFFEITGVDEIFIPKSEDIPENHRREGFQPLAIVGNLRAINGAKFCIEVYRDHIYYTTLRNNKMKLNQDNKDYFKQLYSISTHSKTYLTLNNSKLVQLLPKSAYYAEVYASNEVQEMSLVAETEANQQPDYCEKNLGFQGIMSNPLLYSSEMSYPHQGCSVTSTSPQMQKLHNKIPSSNSPNFASGDRQTTQIEAPSSNIHSFTIGDTQITLPKTLSSFLFNSHPPNSNLPRFRLSDLQLTQIKTLSSHIPSFIIGNTQITLLKTLSSNPPSSNPPSSNLPSRNLPSGASGDIKITQTKAPTSNIPSLVIDDTQIIPISTPNGSLLSRNSPSFASGDMQVTQIEAPSSNPQSLASGDIQITQTEVASNEITIEGYPSESGKMILLELLQFIGYDGPMPIKSSSEIALKIGLESPEFNQFIVYLTEELRKYMDISVRITPMTNPLNSNIFSAELEQFLREIHCPYLELFQSAGPLWFQISTCKHMLISYLVVEITNKRLHKLEQSSSSFRTTCYRIIKILI